VGQKRIYQIPNPSAYYDEEEKKTNKNEFKEYYLTDVRQINFRA
jgi:hypothetical protein